MSALRFYNYPGWGTFAREHLNYSQAVRVGDRIEISGQGGWDPNIPSGSPEFPSSLEDEIAQAFKNVDINLRDAGGKGWEQVFRVNTYALDIDAAQPIIAENYRKWMPNHQPIWTSLGISRLGDPRMRIEIEVVAFDPEGAKEAEKVR